MEFIQVQQLTSKWVTAGLTQY